MVPMRGMPCGRDLQLFGARRSQQRHRCDADQKQLPGMVGLEHTSSQIHNPGDHHNRNSGFASQPSAQGHIKAGDRGQSEIFTSTDEVSLNRIGSRQRSARIPLSRIDACAARCMLRAMWRFANIRLARMSSGQHCLIRDLGLVKGGKGLRHHELVVELSCRGLVRFAATGIRSALHHINRKPSEQLGLRDGAGLTAEVALTASLRSRPVNSPSS